MVLFLKFRCGSVFAVFDIDRRVDLGGRRRVHGDSAHIFLSFSPRCSLSIPDTIIQIFIRTKRLTASARSPNFSPRVPFFWRRLYLKKKAFLVPSSSSVSLALFSSLLRCRCCCCCCSPGLLSLLLLRRRVGNRFFFCVDLFEKLNRKERSGKKEIQKYQERVVFV